MKHPSQIIEATGWKSWLPIISLAMAIATPASYLLGISRQGSEGGAFGGTLNVVGISVLCAFGAALFSLTALLMNRRSLITWLAAVFSLVESGVAVWILLALRGMHF